MAIYKILRLNKMTCGNRRGLIDMDVQLPSMYADLYLLPGTEQSNQDFEYADGHKDVGIITESNTDYKYDKTDALYDYPGNLKRMMNIEGETSEFVVNEKQLSIEFNTYMSSGASYYQTSSDAIQLTPEFWLLSSSSALEMNKMNSELSSIRVIYEFELDTSRNYKALLSSSSTGMLLPLNDLLDLCVKSKFKKSAENYAIPGNLLLQDYQMVPNRNVDQYFVFEEAPVDICQFKNNAFIVSKPMTLQPYRLQSDLKSQMAGAELGSAHTFSLVQDHIQTILYPGVSQYAVQTYKQYLSIDASRYLEEKKLVDVFTPAMSIKGIDYNYIVELQQNASTDKQFDNRTIYENGDVYGFFTTAKNMYNALYSMEMSSSIRMSNCREYASVQDGGDKLILKFYDMHDYDIIPNELSNAQAIPVSVDNQQQKTYPYQKIESYQPVEYDHMTYHKSNLFSIKLHNTGLDDINTRNYDEEQMKIADSMKKSIQNAMKHLVDSIAPANTQLFDTYFVNYD